MGTRPDGFLGHTQTGPTYIGEDNQAVITLASKEAGTHGRTKHFTGRINYLIDNVKNGIIRLEYLRTEDQKADGLTKPFGLKAQEKQVSRRLDGKADVWKRGEESSAGQRRVVQKGNKAREV